MKKFEKSKDNEKTNEKALGQNEALEEKSDSELESVASGSAATKPMLISSKIVADDVRDPKIGRKILSVILILLLSAGICIFSIEYYPILQDQFSSYISEIEQEINTDTFYNGVIVNGMNLGGKSLEEAKLLVKSQDSSRNISITVNYGNKSLVLTQDDFDFTSNIDDTLKAAYNTGKNGNVLVRKIIINSLEKNPIEFNTSSTLNIDNLSRAVEKVKNAVNVKVKNPSVKTFNVTSATPFTYNEGQNGLELIEDEFTTKLRDLLKEHTVGTITAPTKETPCSTSLESIKNSTQLLSTFSTIATSGVNSAHNMKVAFKAINGTILKPGDTFSFNGITGQRLPSKGYVRSSTISGGRVIQTYGGGVCQAATTIYGAAIRANMTIIQRHNHRWKSSYVPIGLDATINYPDKDLKFKNDSKNKVYIGCYMVGTTLYCKIYGTPSAEYDKIETSSVITKSVAPGATQYKTDSSLAPGTSIVYIKSRTGYYASAKRIYYKNGKVVKSQDLPSSYYAPVTGVTLVGR